MIFNTAIKGKLVIITQIGNEKKVFNAVSVVIGIIANSIF